jgi:tetratricopeptide (TPR) repeat protein
MRTFFVSLLLLLATPALAEETAREHYDRATSFYALGQYGPAADEYEKAFSLKPDPALLYNAAQAHRLAGNKQRALLLYQNYLRVFSDRVANKAEVQRHVLNLRKAIETDEKTQTSPPIVPVPMGQKAAEERAESLPSRSPPPPQPAPPPEVTPTPTATPSVSPGGADLTARAPERPIWKKGWFWGAVGGAAAVAIVVGVTVGVVVGGAPKDPMPSFGYAVGN